MSMSAARTVTVQRPACRVLLTLRVYNLFEVGIVSQEWRFGKVMFPSLVSAAESDCRTLKHDLESVLIAGPPSDNTVNTLSCGASSACVLPALVCH